MINMKKYRNEFKKVRVPIVVNEYTRRKEILRKMVQMRVKHQLEEEWHNIIEGDG
jgi:hypothetical protein